MQILQSQFLHEISAVDLLSTAECSPELYKAISVHFCILAYSKCNLSASSYFSFVLKIIRIQKIMLENGVGGGYVDPL